MELPGAAEGGKNDVGELEGQSSKEGKLGLTRTRFRRRLKVARTRSPSSVGLSRRRTVLFGRGETGSAISSGERREGGQRHTRTAEVNSQRPLYVHLLTRQAVRSKGSVQSADESQLRGEDGRRSRLEDSLCRILEDTTRLPFDALLEHSRSGFRPVCDERTEETSRRIGRGPWQRLRVGCGGEMRRPRWDRRRWSGHLASPVKLLEALWGSRRGGGWSAEKRWRGTQIVREFAEFRRDLPRRSPPSSVRCTLHRDCYSLPERNRQSTQCRQHHHRPSSSSERASLAP